MKWNSQRESITTGTLKKRQIGNPFRESSRLSCTVSEAFKNILT